MSLRAVAIPLLMLSALSSSAAHADRVLPIAPVTQATPVWCWLAVGEMVFRYFDVPAVNEHFQCGLIGAISIGTAKDICASDCTKCTVPGGDATTVTAMLTEYPRRASLLKKLKSPRLFVSHGNVLTVDEVRKELDGDRPILAGISPAGRPQAFGPSAHVALIVGYENVDGGLRLVVNDPFPFSSKTWADPYLKAGATLVSPGRYLVDYAVYTGAMGWAESFLVRADGWHHVVTRHCLAATPLSQTSCPSGPLDAPGTPCRCGIASGVVVDGD